MPDRLREPLVLCYLQGLTRDEAAQQLGCPPSTLKSRLEQARERLRRRLIARGLTLTGALVAALFAESSAPASIPPALFNSTVNAAVRLAAGTPAGELVSARVAALAEGALRSTALTKSQLAAIALLVAAALAGVTQRTLPAAAGDAEQHKVAAEADPPASNDTKERRSIDAYGDPLPDGAVMRLGTLQRRAVGAQLAVSADGKSVVSVRGGRYVTIFDAETGKLRERRTLTSKAGARYGGSGWGLCALSPDGSRLITDGLPDGKLFVWDTNTGEIVRQLTVKDAHVICPVAFGPDGKSVAGLAHVGNERLVKVWSPDTGAEAFSQHLATNVWSDRFFFTPDGKGLLATFASNELGTCCWDLATGKTRWQNKEFMPSSLVISPAGRAYSATPEYPSLDVATGQYLPVELPVSRLRDSRLALTPDGKTLLISTERGVIVWDTASGQTVRTLAGAGEEVVAAPDNKTIYTNSGSLQRWDLATGKPLWSEDFEQGHTGEVVSVAFSAGGKRLVSGSADGSVRVWDTATGKPLHVWRAHLAQRPPIGTLALAKGGVDALDISPDGRWVLSAGREETLKLFDATTGKLARVIRFPPRQRNEGSRQVLHLRVSADGKRAVAILSVDVFAPAGQQPTGNPFVVTTWDLETSKLINTRACEPFPAALSPDGERAVVNGAVVHVASGKVLARLEGWPKEGTDLPVAFSRDGALVVGGAVTETRVKRADGEQTMYGPAGVRVWEVATGKAVARLPNKWWTGQVAFHADNRFVITNDYGGVQVWDAVTGRVVARRPMPEELRGSTTMRSYASCVAVAPGGRRLATSHPDGTILLWDGALPAEPAKPLTTAEAETLWSALKEPDGGKAWRAVWRLAEAPDQALPLLKRALKPAAAAPDDVTRPLIADLDAKAFEQRERAGKRLKELGDTAAPALRDALRTSASVEQRRRIEELLAAFATPAPPAGDVLLDLRVVALLERLGTAEARDLLMKLAGGLPDAQKTKAARASLERLTR